MQRTSVSFGGRDILLAQGTDIEGLKVGILRALTDGGAYVDFVAVGNVSTSALVTSGFPIVFRVDEVPDDSRDDGDTDRPFDALEVDDFSILPL